MIVNPLNNRQYSLFSVSGRNILKAYISNYKNGGMMSDPELSEYEKARRRNIKRIREELGNMGLLKDKTETKRAKREKRKRRKNPSNEIRRSGRRRSSPLPYLLEYEDPRKGMVPDDEFGRPRPPRSMPKRKTTKPKPKPKPMLTVWDPVKAKERMEHELRKQRAIREQTPRNTFWGVHPPVSSDYFIDIPTSSEGDDSADDSDSEGSMDILEFDEVDTKSVEDIEKFFEDDKPTSTEIYEGPPITPVSLPADNVITPRVVSPAVSPSKRKKLKLTNEQKLWVLRQNEQRKKLKGTPNWKDFSYKSIGKRFATRFPGSEPLKDYQVGNILRNKTLLHNAVIEGIRGEKIGDDLKRKLMEMPPSDTLEGDEWVGLGERVSLDELEERRRALTSSSSTEIIRFKDGGVYEGEVKDGKMHGMGKLTYHNGSVYEGKFKEDKPQGMGKIIYLNGIIYEGEFKDGKKHGMGKIIYPNGKIYEGKFKDGKSHGKGKLTFPNGIIFEGRHTLSKSNNTRKLFGVGKITYPNGSVYQGEVVIYPQFYKQGRGKLTYPPIRIFVDWVNDAAVYKNVAEKVYEGEFLNDKRHGRGKVTYHDGDTYEGEFKDDKLHGKVEVRYNRLNIDGERYINVYNEVYKNGELISETQIK